MNRSNKQLEEVESEIERWESLLSEPETRWDSFAQGRAPTTTTSPSLPTTSTSTKVRFEDDVANITANQPFTGPDMSVLYEGPQSTSNVNMSVNEQLTSTMEQVGSDCFV